jgi:hypothetical protein
LYTPFIWLYTSKLTPTGLFVVYNG